MQKLYFLLCIFPILAFANIDERKTDVYFANGILTDPADAQYNAESLLAPNIQNLYANEAEFTKHIGEVSYAYNQTANFGADSLETLLQKFGWDWLTNLFIPSHKPDLQLQIDKYKASINSGHRVLVVAHSQGNLYTYEAYNGLADWMQEYFEAVTIASPMKADIKPKTERIDWDNDIAARIANLGASDLADLNSSVRNIDWKLDYTQYPVGFVPPPGSKPARYSYVSELGRIVERDCSAGARSRTICRFEATEGGVNTNVHAFTFYMGDVLRDGNDQPIFNPFTDSTLRDTTAKTKIMTAIKNKLTVLETKPSQWTIESNNEATNVCAERRAELKHFQDAVAPMDQVYPFNIATNADGRQIGKVYQPDVNRPGEYVLASSSGTNIINIENQGVILDDSGNDVGCYQLEGTDGQIVKGCGNTKPTDGVLEVDLSWKSPDIDLTLSVIKEDVGVGKLDKIEQCPKRHWYIASEEDVTKGTYFVHINAEDVAKIDDALLPETLTLKIDAPGGGLKISIDIPSTDLLNMGAVAKIIVTKPEGGGVGVAVEVTEHPDVEYTATQYKYNDKGTVYDYETVSLLNRIELGPIANAQIEIMSLSASDFGQVVYSGYTSSGDTLDTNGLMLLPPSFKQSVASDGLYLISATGGEDVDTDDDLNMDATATSNFGTIHAIVSGAAIKENGLKVNILTELGYQVSKELLLNAEDALGTLTKLDEAAQALLIEDMNKDGVIDRYDFQSWIPSFDKPKLRVDYNSKIHPIVLKVYKADDIQDDAQQLIYPTTPPVANAGEDLSINFGESVTLDGSGSYDSDGYIAEYLWYKDGTIYCKSNTSECTVEGLTAGYNVFELVVKDDKGAVGRDSVKVFVDSHGVLLGSYDTNSYALRVTLSPDGTIAYVADAAGGLYLIDINQPAEPYLIKHLATWENTQSTFLSEDGTTAYLADIYGLEIIDVTNPLEAQRVGRYTITRSARDVVASADGSVAYILDYYNGLQIIDISNWTSPSLIGSYMAGGNAYRLTLSSDENIAYIAYGGSGLQIVDITNPAAPVLISEYRGRSVYGVTVSPDGNTAYLANGNYGVRIIDISDPKNPFFIGRYDTPGYAKNVALSKSGNVLYVADGSGGVQILDISNPEELTLIGSPYSGQAYDVALSSDDTILYIAGHAGGLQIIDVSDFKR